jgi:hypothetical protein
MALRRFDPDHRRHPRQRLKVRGISRVERRAVGHGNRGDQKICAASAGRLTCRTHGSEHAAVGARGFGIEG